MKVQVAFHPTTRIATVQAAGKSLPSGTVNVGEFYHPDLTYPDSLVIYHGVRDLLYRRSHANPANIAKFPENITDMHNIQINADPLIEVASVSMTPETANVAVGATQQLTATVLPTDAGIKTVKYVSSDPTKATVSATGLVTGVAIGSTTITVTTDSGGKTDTSLITVVAA